MRAQLQHALVKEFPLLYEDSSIECGDGWFYLIRDLSKKLYPLIEKARMTSNEFDIYPTVSQVKEKYGTLRFYMYSSTDEMNDLIYIAEDQSPYICELCGEAGTIDESKCWLECRCKTCRKP
jgi:hypothetical protein